MTGLAPLGLVAPSYDGLGLGAILPACADSLGVRMSVAGIDGATRRAQLGLPRAERVCVVLVDGLGHQLLEERAGHAPFMRGLLPSARALVAGFPSTTAASIGLFGTGCGAGQTALVGYTARNPATGALVNLVSWEGLTPTDRWQREPRLLHELVDEGVTVTATGPSRFAHSGLTEATLRGGTYVGAETLGQRVDTAVRALRSPGFVYLYWGESDKIGHHHGWGSPQWAEALVGLDAELARLRRELPAGTLLLVTADHGMVDVDPAAHRDVATSRALRPGVELVAGEPRAMHLHCVPGETEAVARRWTDELAGDAIVLLREEAIGLGLFGPVAEHVRPIIGDVVVAMTGAAAVVDSRTQSAASRALIGLHGSLTPGEMRVPLLVTG
jgi:hypothetical protein